MSTFFYLYANNIEICCRVDKPTFIKAGFRGWMDLISLALVWGTTDSMSMYQTNPDHMYIKFNIITTQTKVLKNRIPKILIGINIKYTYSPAVTL